MKIKIFLLCSLFAALTLQAQVSKTVNCTAGALATLLTSTEKATVTNLTLTGTIDSRDFPIMKNMPLLAVIDMSIVTIAAYNGAGGGEIPQNAFYFNKILTEVTIPTSVTSIGSSAFSGCSRLTSVTIPNSVTSIGSSAFNGCSGLITVDISNPNYSSADGILFNKNKTKLIQCPTSKSGSYIIPNSVTSIGDGAFSGCSGLTSVTIPTSVTGIGYFAFSGCSGLITVDNSNLEFSSIEGVLLNKDKTKLIQCPTSKSGSYTIPNSVTSIGSYAFNGCSGLTLVTIPNSVTSISSFAFKGCSGLTSVTIPNSVTSIDHYAFHNCSGLTSATLPNMVTSISESTFEGCNRLLSVTIPNSVNSIGPYAFKGCSGLTSITIPNSVTSIGEWAFSGCSGLTSVTIPNSATSIGSYAFNDCIGLTAITIPNSVSFIGNGAFNNCSGLTSVTIPNSVTSIGPFSFEGCIGLTSVTIPNSVTNIGLFAFSHCSKLTSVTIPNSVTSISEWAFNGCSGLTSIAIPNSVTSIGERAFKGCSGLTSVTIPNSVTSIGNNAFVGSSGFITVDNANPNYSSTDGVLFNKNKTTLIQCPTSKSGSYTIPNSVTTIESRAFNDCIELTSLTIPNSVTSIDYATFEGCSGLISVTIPNSVTTIGPVAFNGCSGLTSVTTYAKIPISIDSYVFYKVEISTDTLYVPAGSKALYQVAPVWKDFGNIVEMIDVSVQSQALANVKIYPNPVVESFKISGLIGEVEIIIMNSIGQVVLHQNVFENQAIVVGSLKKGVYFVKAHNKKGTTVIKFLKK